MARIGKIIFAFLTLTDDQRQTIDEKVLDFGNIGASALVFGSALAEGHVKWLYMISGVLWWVITFFIYILLTKHRGEEND